VFTTGASNEALGAILSQGPTGRDLPIGYVSRTLVNAENNYTTTKKELLAIVWGCKRFRQFLYGTKFTIVTDHKPLTWVFNVKVPSSRLLRWILKLEEYDYDIVYKPGVRNTNAGALSRINMPEVNTATKVSSEPTEEEKGKILREFHQSPTGGHLGMNRTFERIKSYTSWPGMKRETENYVRHSETCQQNKITRRKTKLPLHITDTPDVVWQNSSLDIVGPLTLTSENNRYLLAFQDELSKYTVAAPIQQQDAMTVARVFVREMFFKFGIPQVILTDQSSYFLSDLFSNVCELLREEN
jgi:hypothetical protein